MQKGSYTNQNFIGLFSSSYMWSGLIMNQSLKKFSTPRRYQKYLKWILMFWNVYVIEINLNVKIIWRMLMQQQSPTDKYVKTQKPALPSGSRTGILTVFFSLLNFFFSDSSFASLGWRFLLCLIDFAWKWYCYFYSGFI
jgi:hypothetical protein